MRYDMVVLYYFPDEFCKVYEAWERSRLLPYSGQRHRAGIMSLSEMLLIAVCYHLSGYECFKYFYLCDIGGLHRDKFPRLLSYSRFVQVMPRLFVPLCVLLQTMRGEETGIYFMDSTGLSICHNRRIQRSRVFAGLAARGKSTMGWFYGFKLHLVINHKGQIMAVKITKANVNDRHPVEAMTKGLQGILAADKGYLSKKLFNALYQKGLKLLTGIRKNMRNILMPINEKKILRRRFFIETVFGSLKTQCNIEHTRHRSAANALVNIIAAIVAYAYKTRNQKPALIQN
jgi:hypothetical protein